MGSTTINDGSAQDVAYVQYGAVRLHYSKVQYSGQVVDDPAMRYTERTTITISVEGYATRDMYDETDKTAGGLPATLTQAWLSQELARKGQTFIMRGDQGEIFQIRPASARATATLSDESSHANYQFIRTCVDRGPHVRNISVALMGADSFFVRFVVTADVYGESVNEDRYGLKFGRQHVLAARQLLSYYGTVGYLIDGATHLQSRNISATARFAREVNSTDADDLRSILAANSIASMVKSGMLNYIPQIGLAPPKGFVRESCQVTVGPDEFTLQVQVRDVEQYAIVPPPCSAGEATHEVSFGWWGAIYNATFSGWLEAPPDVPKSRILDVMFRLVNGRMARKFDTGSSAVNSALSAGAGALFSVSIRDELFRNRIAFSFTYMGISWLAQFSKTQLGSEDDQVPQVPRDDRPDLRLGFFTSSGLQRAFGIGLRPEGSTGQHHHPGLNASGQDIGQYALHGNAVRQLGGSLYGLWDSSSQGGGRLGYEIVYPPRMGPSAGRVGGGSSTNVTDLRGPTESYAGDLEGGQNTKIKAEQRKNAEFYWQSKRRYLVTDGVRRIPLASRNNSAVPHRKKTVTAPTVTVVDEGFSIVIQPADDPPLMAYPDSSLEWSPDLVDKVRSYNITGGSAFPTLDGKVVRKYGWLITIVLCHEASAKLLKDGVVPTTTGKAPEESSGGSAKALEIWKATPKIKKTPMPGQDGGIEDGGTTATRKPED